MSSSISPEQTLQQFRNLVNIITTTEERQLYECAHLCLSIVHASSVLEDAYTQSATGGRCASELSTLLHKYKTRISSLLQSRIGQARWIATCLIKSSVETSSHMLQSYGIWIPLLVKVLSKPESAVTAERTIATLSQIFSLTISKPALTRELTTPHLPGYLNALFAFNPLTSEHLLPILHSIDRILQTHPTTFRPFAQKTLVLSREVLGLQSTEAVTKSYYNKETCQVARVIFTSLHRCAPQKAHAEEWSTAFKSIVEQAEEVGNILFQCVVEDRDREDASNKIISDRPNPLSVEEQGIPRMSSLLRVLQTFISQPSPESPLPSLAISPLLQLLTRFFSLTMETPAHPLASPSTYHLLLAHLPNLHCHALSITNVLVKRLSREHSSCIILRLLNEIVYNFNSGAKNYNSTRTASYQTLQTLVNISGNTFSQKEGKSMNDILSTACDDLVPPPLPVISSSKEITSVQPTMLLTQPRSTYKKRKVPPNPNKSNTPHASTSHADNFLSPSSQENEKPSSLLYPLLVEAASSLLTTVLSHLPPNIIRSELRSKIERTVVVTQNVDGVLAAVMYPGDSGKRGSSLLPHLVGLLYESAISASSSLGIEGVVWPRMQVVSVGSTIRPESSASSEASDEEEDEDSNMQDQPPEPAIMSLPTVLNSPLPGISCDDPSRYPTPPPAPVPHHAVLPRSPVLAHTSLPLPSRSPVLTQPALPVAPHSPVLAHASLPPPRSPNNITISLPPRQPNAITVPATPGRVSQVMPPSPLRQSMSIFEPEEREIKRLKLDQGDEGMKLLGDMRGQTEGLGLKKIDLENNEDDDDEEIPEIVMDGDTSDDEE